jgi:hypothetical protein
MSTALPRDTREEQPLTREQFARAIAVEEFGVRTFRMGQQSEQRMTPGEHRASLRRRR